MCLCGVDSPYVLRFPLQRRGFTKGTFLVEGRRIPLSWDRASFFLTQGGLNLGSKQLQPLGHAVKARRVTRG